MIMSPLTLIKNFEFLVLVDLERREREREEGRKGEGMRRRKGRRGKESKGEREKKPFQFPSEVLFFHSH